MKIVSQTVAAIQIGQPMSAGGLTMYPLLAEACGANDYLLLDDALEGGMAEVTEVSDAGSVQKLHFRNRAAKDILLLDGEALVGAKQNRVLNLSILVGPGQDVDIPVSCVEAGRWSWRSKRFAAGRSNLHGRSREEKMRGVSARMAATGDRADPEIQASVWRSIDAKMAAFRVDSATRSLNDVYRAKGTRLTEVRDAFPAASNQVGAVFAVGHRLVGFDLYDNPKTLGRLLPKLIDSYALDAIEEEGALDAPSPSLLEVQSLLKRVADGPGQEYPAVAKGTDVRIKAETVHAAALIFDGRIVHLAAFQSMMGS